MSENLNIGRDDIRKVCGQVDIPEVDNTAMECDMFLSAKCVALDDAITQLGATSGEILHNVLTRIGTDFRELKNSFANLVKQINPEVLGGSYDFSKDQKLLDFINGKLNLKVDKIGGKGLSSNDFTNKYLTDLQDATTKVADLLRRISTSENLTSSHTQQINSLQSLTSRLQSEVDSLKVNPAFSFRFFDGSTYKSVNKDTVVQVKGDTNVSATVDAEGVKVSLSETPTFRSATIGGKTISDGESDFNNTKIGNVLGGSLDSGSKEVVVGGQIHTLRTQLQSSIESSKQDVLGNLSAKEDKSNKKKTLVSVTNADDNYPSVSLMNSVVKTATDKITTLESKVDNIKYGKSISNDGTILQLKDQLSGELSRVDLRPLIESVAGSGGGSGAPTSLYMWVRYSANPDGTGLTADPTTNSEYIGIAINKDSLTPSNDKLDYKWFRFKGDRGATGERGQQGTPGLPGAKGADGVNAYVHIRYSTSADGTGFVQQPTSGTIYMGVHSSSRSTAPTSKTDYVWVRIRGLDGSNASVDTSQFVQKGGYTGTAKNLDDRIKDLEKVGVWS